MTETAIAYRNGDLRVYHIQNPPAAPTWYDVKTPKDGLSVINKLAERDLDNALIWANAIGLCVYEDGDWVDWYDEEGDDLDAWAEKQEAQP